MSLSWCIEEEEKPGQNGAVSPQLRVAFGSVVLVVCFLEKMESSRCIWKWSVAARIREIAAYSQAIVSNLLSYGGL